MTKESLLKPGDILSKSSGSRLALTLDVLGTVRVLITMICKVIYLSFSTEVASTLFFSWILEELLTHTIRPQVIECLPTAFNSNMDLLAGTQPFLHRIWVELLLKYILCLFCWLCWGLVFEHYFFTSVKCILIYYWSRYFVFLKVTYITQKYFFTYDLFCVKIYYSYKDINNFAM